VTRHAHVSQFESKNGYRHNFSNSKIRGRDAVGVTLRYPILPANPANGRKSASKFSYFRGRDTPFYTLLVNIVVPRPRTNPTRLISKAVLRRHGAAGRTSSGRNTERQFLAEGELTQLECESSEGRPRMSEFRIAGSPKSQTRKSESCSRDRALSNRPYPTGWLRLEVHQTRSQSSG